MVRLGQISAASLRSPTAHPLFFAYWLKHTHTHTHTHSLTHSHSGLQSTSELLLRLTGLSFAASISQSGEPCDLMVPVLVDYITRTRHLRYLDILGSLPQSIVNLFHLLGAKASESPTSSICPSLTSFHIACCAGLDAGQTLDYRIFPNLCYVCTYVGGDYLSAREMLLPRHARIVDLGWDAEGRLVPVPEHPCPYLFTAC
jgi:hypothetical protein